MTSGYESDCTPQLRTGYITDTPATSLDHCLLSICESKQPWKARVERSFVSKCLCINLVPKSLPFGNEGKALGGKLFAYDLYPDQKPCLRNLTKIED